MSKIVLTSVVTLLSAGVGHAQQGHGIDPKAIEIAQNSSEFLSSQPQIAVNWLITYDEILAGREKRTSVWTGDSLFSRGEGYRSSSVRGTEVRDYVFDGQTFSAIFADQSQFAQITVPGSFADLSATLDADFDFPLPMSDLFDQSGTAEGLAAATDAIYVGEMMFGGQVAHHLAFRRHEGDWEMWISADEENPVPLMITGSNPYLHGWPKFQALLYDWDFEPAINSEAFDFRQPDGFEKIELPKIGETSQ